jgi:hypothetical protein
MEIIYMKGKLNAQQIIGNKTGFYNNTGHKEHKEPQRTLRYALCGPLCTS